MQPDITPYEYSSHHYVEQPYYAEGAHYQPYYSTHDAGRYIEVPEYAHHAEPEVRYVAVEPVHHSTVHEPVAHHTTAHDTRYVEVPEELYTRYMAGHLYNESVHHAPVQHGPMHHDVLTTHE